MGGIDGQMVQSVPLTPVVAPPRAKRDRAHSNLSSVLDEIGASLNPDTPDSPVRLGVIVNAVGRRAYGPLLLVVGLFAISPITVIPGMTWLSALLVVLISAQMAIGLSRPWLPAQALRMSIPRDALIEGLEQARPWAVRIDAVLSPRLTFLSAPLWVNLIALCCGLAGLIMIPLGLIPFAPFIPSLAVVIFGLGMTARDGVWLLVGTAIVGSAVALALPLIL